ncbi:MAG: hypothetical protein KAV25_08800 [Methanophagales archaeon]|nr:hypothetical protein [Methanophagales archaeon]
MKRKVFIFKGRIASRGQIIWKFMITRRKLQNLSVLTDDVPTQELMQLVMESRSFDWLDAKEEDVYSIEDGKAVKWLSKYSEHTG